MDAKQANLSKEEIRKAVEAGTPFVVLEWATGKVASLHKSRSSADRKVAKLGQSYNVHDFKVGYVY